MPRRLEIRLSAHFVLAEFDSLDGGLVPYKHRPALAHLAEWWLEPLRAMFGRVTVHSGYRTAAHNLAVGGAKQSVHMLTTALPDRPRGSVTVAAAADVSCATGDPQRWSDWAREHRQRHHHLAWQGRGGVGQYSSFVHLDTASVRDWRVR